MTIFTLNDGIEVELSTRKSNRSGYTGAALSPSWTLDAERPFIAACGNPTDPTVMAEVNAQHRTSLHLGSYRDAREAAYVVGRYRKYPVETIREIQSHGNATSFPDDLYSLPPGLAYEDAVEILNARKKATKSCNSVQTKLDVSSVPATGNLYDYFSRDQIVTIAKSLGGPDAFQGAIKGLSVLDFAKKFDLSVA
jgi:hypothetical protein